MYNQEHRKLDAIYSAESIAEKIIEAGTIWRYEKRLAPGESEKKRMSATIENNLKTDLRNYVDALEDAALDNDLSKLKREIPRAQDYVKTLKQNLGNYQNTNNLEKLIKSAENAIRISEIQVRRINKETNQSTELVVSKPAKRARNTSGDFLDRVLQAKRYQSHLPLTSTQAGEPTVVNSMRALSTRPRSLNTGEGGSSSRKRKHSDDGDGSPSREGRRRPGDDDGDDPGHGDGGPWRDASLDRNARRTRTALDERSMVARLPPLSPEQFYWDG